MTNTLAALAVAAGVGQGLLGNAIDGVFKDRNQATELDAGAEGDLRPVLLFLFVHEVGDGRHDPGLVEDRRPHAADQSAGLELALAEHRHPGGVGLGGFFGFRLRKCSWTWNCMMAPARFWARPSWMS